MKKIFKKIVVFILTLEARAVLWRHKPKVVGITGSVGKTSAKEAVGAVLGRRFSVRKSKKSFNSELGVPLTVLDLETAWGSAAGWLKNILKGFWIALFSRDYPEWLVLEMGVDRPGDMAHLAKWMRLDVAVITYIGDMPVHGEFFPSVEDLVEEKAKILTALKDDGVAILAYGDERVRMLKEKTKCRVYTFGTVAEADIHAGYYQIVYDANGLPEGINFKVMFQGNVMPVTLRGILGRQFMYPILAAFSVGMAQGLQVVEMTDALLEWHASPGRMRIIEGLAGSVLIDDTYNSSPIAAFEALDTMKTLEVRGKKIAVLGDMAELGAYSEEAHAKVGEACAGAVGMLVAVGSRSGAVADAARGAGVQEIHSFGTSTEAGDFLKDIVNAGDIVLIKGSQSMRMERVTEALMAHPERKGELLVRQEEEWARR